jgi:hypothetical protein
MNMVIILTKKMKIVLLLYRVVNLSPIKVFKINFLLYNNKNMEIVYKK